MTINWRFIARGAAYTVLVMTGIVAIWMPRSDAPVEQGRKAKFYWERIAVLTCRMEVPGGWIVRTSTGTVFVKDDGKRWR